MTELKSVVHQHQKHTTKTDPNTKLEGEMLQTLEANISLSETYCDSFNIGIFEAIELWKHPEDERPHFCSLRPAL